MSILVETEHEELCITSYGKKYENQKTIKKYEKKLVKLQRELAYKEKKPKPLQGQKKDSNMP